MVGLEWLDGYTGQSTRELIALEGHYRADSLVLAFEQALVAKAEKRGIGGLTPEERVVIAIEALEREVNSGGYEHFFSVTPDVIILAASSALERIGRIDLARLTTRAIHVVLPRLATSVPPFALAVENLGDNELNLLDECDEEYQRISGDLAGHLFEFIKVEQSRISLKSGLGTPI